MSRRPGSDHLLVLLLRFTVKVVFPTMTERKRRRRMSSPTRLRVAPVPLRDMPAREHAQRLPDAREVGAPGAPADLSGGAEPL